ncbi:MAG: transcriptional repressor [Prevotella sp.]|nr:transcriptional repressor [Prevotella sp.]
MQETLEYLEHHGIKPTAVRMLVWEKASLQTETFSLHDMEAWMPHMDKSSIFRALRLFVEHDLLHIIDDGTGQQKYCVCRCEANHHINHIHFTCTKCGKTYCLEDYEIPIVEIPDGFQMQEVEYIVKGICSACAQ